MFKRTESEFQTASVQFHWNQIMSHNSPFCTKLFQLCCHHHSGAWTRFQFPWSAVWLTTKYTMYTKLYSWSLRGCVLYCGAKPEPYVATAECLKGWRSHAHPSSGQCWQLSISSIYSGHVKWRAYMLHFRERRAGFHHLTWWHLLDWMMISALNTSA